MSMQTLTRDVDAAAVAGNSDAYGLALATQARQKSKVLIEVCPNPNNAVKSWISKYIKSICETLYLANLPIYHMWCMITE